MPFYDTEHPDQRVSLGVRVKRARTRKRRRIATVAVVAVALVAFGTVKAFAWHSLASASRTCEGVAVTVTVPDEDWVEDDTTASGTVQVGDQSKPWSISGAGSQSVFFSLPTDATAGTATVVGSFNTGESAGGTASYGAASGCEQEAVPPVEEQPPVDEPKDEPIAGTAASKTRTAPKRHRAEPTPDDSPELGTPDQPGTLPFTGPNDLLLPVGLVLIVAGAWLLVYTGRRQREHNLAAAAVARALRKPYRGPRETL